MYAMQLHATSVSSINKNMNSKVNTSYFFVVGTLFKLQSVFFKRDDFPELSNFH